MPPSVPSNVEAREARSPGDESGELGSRSGGKA